MAAVGADTDDAEQEFAMPGDRRLRVSGKQFDYYKSVAEGRWVQGGGLQREPNPRRPSRSIA